VVKITVVSVNIDLRDSIVAIVNEYDRICLGRIARIAQMRPIATFYVAWSVCVCVCVLDTCTGELCKNGRTDQDTVQRGLTCVGSRKHVLDEVERSHGNGQFWGVVWPIEMHWESLLRCMQQQGSFCPQ